jgi:hypothetical protein
MKDDNDRKYENHEEDNLINKNSSGAEFDSKRAIDDPHHSNVDPQKPQFERSNLQPDQEKRAGSGGAAMDPGKREDRQNNGNDNK